MKIYLIAAGGSGAKVAEALIHVCGAGLGPVALHLLSVDTDDDNGNLARLDATHAAYRGCQKFKWSRDGKPLNNTPVLFATNITFQKLSALTSVSSWGLRDANICPTEYGDVLDLFFTHEEQVDTCKEGFLAHPDHGSLIMGKHISDEFSKTGGEAAAFLSLLRDDMNAGADFRLVVVGSVFGGTGASVLPVLPDSILEALRRNLSAAAATAVETSWEKIHKSAVMLMPYFFPSGAPPSETGTVDPSRFMADTQNALAHYHTSGAAQKYSNIHLVGSDDAAQQRPRFCQGSVEQRNDPSIVELIAALACLEPPTPSLPVRVLNPAEHAEHLNFDDLPWPNGERGALDFSLFLHAATFTVRHRDSPMDCGILQFLNRQDAMTEIPHWPWASEFLAGQSGKIQNFKSSSATMELSKYFLRLLLWSYKISKSRADLSLIEWSEEKDAIVYWDALCAAKKGDDIPDVTNNGNPNPIAITMVAACVSSLRHLRQDAKHRGAKLLEGTVSTVSQITRPSRCVLPFVYNDFAAAETAKEVSLKLTADYENIS